jgi:hypothetical protein
VVIGVFRSHVVWVLLLLAATASAAAAQSSERQPGEQATTETVRRTVGTVEALGRGSIVIRTDQDTFVVYELTRETVRTKVVEPGARVSVLTLASDTNPAPRALGINVLPAKQGLAAPAEPAEPAEAAEIEPAVPPQVQQLTAQIERQARRFRAGLSGGVAIDPELISLDAFATLGPFFSRNLNFRPNVEFAFGEVTTLFGIHLDAIYRLPGVSRSIRWAPYLGAGPSFTFSHRGFEEVDVDDDSDEVDRFNFDDFQWHNGFNFIVGARSPNGTFFEMKSTAWGAANIRVLAGFEF